MISFADSSPTSVAACSEGHFTRSFTSRNHARAPQRSAVLPTNVFAKALVGIDDGVEAKGLDASPIDIYSIALIVARTLMLLCHGQCAHCDGRSFRSLDSRRTTMWNISEVPSKYGTEVILTVILFTPWLRPFVSAFCTASFQAMQQRMHSAQARNSDPHA